MSWFIGYTGKKNSYLTEYISSLNLGQKDEIITGNLHLIYSGKKENLVLNSLPDSSGWIVSGLPVFVENDQELKFMGKNEWENLFSRKDFNLKNIDGHFTGLKWNKKEIIFFNDGLGLRDIYFMKVNSNFFFSTRLDWIAKFNKENEINIDEFSTNWMLPHQISWSSILKNVTMLSPGGIIKISSGVFEKNVSPWMPNFNLNSKPGEFIITLNNFLKLLSSGNEKINLGLSGGIDSRVLLQLLFNNHVENFGTHTFGNLQTADGKISSEIANENKINHSFFTVLLPDKDQLLKNLYGNISQLGLSASIYETLNYPFYKQLRDQDYIIIDGAYGEIFRRAYLNRFLMLGKNALLNL